MAPHLDGTHDPWLRSWVRSAAGHPDFPIQNLPLGIFRVGGGPPRAGIAVGDEVLDLEAVSAAGLLEGEPQRAAVAARGGTLNALLALGAGPRGALRSRLSSLLAEGAAHQAAVEPALRPARDCTMLMPVAVGDYTDFYVGIHHAANVGKIFRPDLPLLPNYKHVPIGYHGRASSVRVSGVPVQRPKGQLKGPGDTEPAYLPCRRLDYELELGVWVGTGNVPGEPVPIDRASVLVGGYCLLNDWSARDVQAWEYQPLGPFLAKSFATTVSPWVITPEALAPFRVAQAPRPKGDPHPLPYLWNAEDQASGALAVGLQVLLTTSSMREQRRPPHRLSSSHARHMYWTVAQMIAHHTSGGCDLRSGDLLGSGTISSPEPSGFGSLLEATRGGHDPIVLPTGEERLFLQDGDEVILRARAEHDDAVPIGFGECRAVITHAV